MTAAPPEGLLVVDKPAGLTSHDVVGRVRRLARTRRVGHAGTLDPMATGVLLLGLGRATRLLGHLALTEKSYAATARLGWATTTDDAEGEPLAATSAAHLTVAAVREAASAYVGEVEQVPSSVSAVKVDGRRAYARVRAGEDVELPARRVTIHALTVLGFRREGDAVDVDLEVRCSSGTYVRAIARDLGRSLGVGGHLTALRRTAVGPVALADATALADLEEGSLPVVGMGEAAPRFFPTAVVDEVGATDVGFGRRLQLTLDRDEPVAVLDASGRLLALYQRVDATTARPVAVFT